MANYFVINNKFKPYSFDELIKPYQMYGEAYKAQEEAYDQLQQDLGNIGSFIDENNASQSWQAYDAYSKALTQAASDLSSHGLTAAGKSSITNLKRDYTTKIQPIATAINRRQKAIEDFGKTDAGKSDRYIGQRPSDTSVDDWLNGNTPELNGVDGKSISDYVKDEVAAASARHYRTYTNKGYRIEKIGTNQVETSQLLDALRTGSRFDDSTAQGSYMNAVLDDIKNNVVNGALTTFGYSKFLAPDQDGNVPEGLQPNTLESKKFLEEVYDGIYRGMAGSEKQTVDQYALEATKHQQDMEEIDRRGMWDAYNKNVPGFAGFDKKGNPIIVGEDTDAQRMSRGDTYKYEGGKAADANFAKTKATNFEKLNDDGTSSVVEVSGPDGTTFTNTLDLYRHVNGLREGLKELRRAVMRARDVNNLPGAGPTTQANYENLLKQQQELTDLINNYETSFGNSLMSSREYNKIKSSLGIDKNNDSFTIGDIDDIIASSDDYRIFDYNEVTIADSKGNPALTEDIGSDIVRNIQKKGGRNIYTTTNGIDRQSLATKKDVSNIKVEDIEQIYIVPDGMLRTDASGAPLSYVCILVKGKNNTDAKQYLVPVDYLDASVKNSFDAYHTVYGDNIGRPIAAENRASMTKDANIVAESVRNSYSQNLAGRLSEGAGNKVR